MTPMNKLLTACVMSLAIGGEFAAYAATTLPQLPQKQVDVTMPTVTGSTLNATCATLQAQLNAAAALNVNLTHQIILATGTTCTGPYKLASHTGGTGWILIKGPNYASLPASGTRVTTSDAALMPQIKYGSDGSGNYDAVFVAQTGAQRYRIIGINMVQDSTITPNWAFVVMGYNNANATNTGYLIVDRSVLRDTDAAHETVRAVYADAQLGNTALIDSYASGIKSRGRDSQAWLSVSNPGPILIQNNFLEDAGENIMLCGGTPANSSEMPHDATIQRNTISKNAAWLPGGSGFVVKTLFELKCGVRVLVEGNTFDGMAYDNGGNAFRLTPRNDDYGGATGTFLEVSDLTIRYNLVRNVPNWINSIGADDGTVNGDSRLQTRHSKRWHIHDNLVYGLGSNCGGGAWCGAFYSIQMGGTTLCTDYVVTCKNEDLTITHNTVDDVAHHVLYVSTGQQKNLDFRDNLINDGGGSSYGIFGNAALGSPFESTQNFSATLLGNAWGATYSFTFNRIAGLGGNGQSPSFYPQGTNSYPSSYTSFLWTNPAARDYTLQAGSPAKNAASDGTDQGVNFSAYNAARAN